MSKKNTTTKKVVRTVSEQGLTPTEEQVAEFGVKMFGITHDQAAKVVLDYEHSGGSLADLDPEIASPNAAA